MIPAWQIQDQSLDLRVGAVAHHPLALVHMDDHSSDRAIPVAAFPLIRIPYPPVGTYMSPVGTRPVAIQIEEWVVHWDAPANWDSPSHDRRNLHGWLACGQEGLDVPMHWPRSTFRIAALFVRRGTRPATRVDRVDRHSFPSGGVGSYLCVAELKSTTATGTAPPATP